MRQRGTVGECLPISATHSESIVSRSLVLFPIAFVFATLRSLGVDSLIRVNNQFPDGPSLTRRAVIAFSDSSPFL